MSLLQNLQELFHTWIQEVRGHDGSKPWPQKRWKECQTGWIQVIKFLLKPKPSFFKKTSDHFRHIMNLDSLQDLWQTVYLHMVRMTFICNKANGTLLGAFCRPHLKEPEHLYLYLFMQAIFDSNTAEVDWSGLFITLDAQDVQRSCIFHENKKFPGYYLRTRWWKKAEL